ncbi:hypothetical protein RRG08_033085 [Elysia crispata]|uniref:Uncharacterized protein n=1 Tax=Elysia crispata TaxID=231223 RepID=A0AAE1DTK5_9GAST|nr:hypothetical protein RRG08_033085 [Elysia crispata]
MRTFILALALLPILQPAAMQENTEEYFDVLGTGCSDWRLAFRGTAHIQKSMYRAYKYGKGIPQDIEDGCKSTDWSAPCNSHYRNDDALDNWSNVREVLYGIVDNGMLVKVMRFDGAGTNNMNWMKQKRLIESSWDDLKDANPNFFRLKGHKRLRRRFFVNNNYGGCRNDAGWTVVVDQENPACSWERNETYPYIKYVAGQRYENWNSPIIKSADAIVVFVSYNPGEPNEYFDPLNTGEEVWRIAFRGTAKVGEPAFAAYEDGTGVKSTVEDACKTLDFQAPCTSHWRNDDALDNWENVDEVLFGIIYKGEIVKTIFFDGEDTTYLDWYRAENLLESPWSDLPTEPHNFFSIEGHERLQRRFFIERNYGGCPNDVGWMVVSDMERRPCSWEKADSYPLIKFAAGSKSENWNTGEVLEADGFVIFLKYEEL